MLTHVVLFKLKDRSPENIAATRDRMALIWGQIPQLRSLEAGINVVEGERAYDIALVETFDSVEAMKAYQAHPVHLDLLKDVVPRFETSAAVDYET
ncbi:MAG: Dabb family protein [Chloroflexi bacterium]|nr:Dabb family protein [Chloroflexota bacterium]